MRTLTFGASLLIAGASACLQAQHVVVRTDRRAEILGVMFRMAGAPEWSDGRIASYVARIDSAFMPYKGLAAIDYIRRIRQEDGDIFAAVVSMAAHVTDPVSFRERSPIDAPYSTLAPEWHGAAARDFLNDARAFARTAHVADFLRLEQPFYDSATTRMQRLMAERMRLNWFERFFGKANGVFIVSPLMVNSGGNFGTTYRDDKTVERYAFIGLADHDSAGFPVIPNDAVPTIAHEFTHSFVNDVVEADSNALRGPGEQIFAVLGDAMRRQGYPNWQIMMYESVVRRQRDSLPPGKRRRGRGARRGPSTARRRFHLDRQPRQPARRLRGAPRDVSDSGGVHAADRHLLPGTRRANS